MIDPWEAMHDRTGADYQAVWNRLRANGYRPLSACIYGPPQAPLYAAIFTQRPGPDVAGVHGVDGAGLQAFFNTHAALGYSPIILSVTGPSHDPLFLCVMEQSSTGVALTRFGLTSGAIGDPNALEHWLEEADRNNWIPRCVAAYGAPGDLRYALVADANDQRLLWAVAGPEGYTDYQSRFEAQTQQYARPVAVSVGPAGFMSIFREDDIGPWEACHGLDSAGYQAVFDLRVGQEGMVPIMVAAGTLNGVNTFAATFARANRPQGRTMRASGRSIPVFAGVDSAITNYLRTTGTRAASVAVTRGDKLVYARSFTWAEPAYPRATPKAMFRIASMSKPITSVAIFRLVERGAFGLDDALIPQLGLVAPAGRALVAEIASITVRQLLAHSSGLGDVPDAYTVVQAYGTVLPANERQIAGFALSGPLNFAPGTSKGYSNTAYLVLGLIVEWATGETYEAAVMRLVMSPLGISRAHLTSAKRSEQRPGAVRHHAGGAGQPDIPLAPSAIAEWAMWSPFTGALLRFGRPWAASAYGGGDYGFFDAFGAWCLAAADFARLLAAFERQPNPLLADASVADMTTPVNVPGVADWTANFALGWYVTQGAPGEAMIGHGGNLGGMKPAGIRSTLGWSYVTLQNSDAWNLSGVVEAALRAIPLDAWPDRSLWASVGVPAW